MEVREGAEKKEKGKERKQGKKEQEKGERWVFSETELWERITRATKWEAMEGDRKE